MTSCLLSVLSRRRRGRCRPQPGRRPASDRRRRRRIVARHPAQGRGAAGPGQARRKAVIVDRRQALARHAVSTGPSVGALRRYYGLREGRDSACCGRRLRPVVDWCHAAPVHRSGNPARIGQSLSMLRGGLPGARWIDPENYHLTLRFIGDVDDAMAREIAWLLGNVRRTEFDAAARWPAVVRRPQAARGGRRRRATPQSDGIAGRARAADAAGRARARGAQIHAACHAGAAARFVEPAGRRLSVGARPFRSPPFRVSRFVLFSSRASVGGGPYVVEAAYPLAALAA